MSACSLCIGGVVVIKKIISLTTVLMVMVVLVSGCAAEVAVKVADEATPPAKPAASEEEAVEEGAFPGMRAYDFMLEDFEGNSVRLSDFQGKTVMLFFWASWCPYCGEQMTQMSRLYAELDPDRYVILGINLIEAEKNRDDALNKIEEKQAEFINLMDAQSEVSLKYGARTIPLSVFIDPDGIITASIVGPLDEGQIMAQFMGAN